MPALQVVEVVVQVLQIVGVDGHPGMRLELQVVMWEHMHRRLGYAWLPAGPRGSRPGGGGAVSAVLQGQVLVHVVDGGSGRRQGCAAVVDGAPDGAEAEAGRVGELQQGPAVGDQRPQRLAGNFPPGGPGLVLPRAEPARRRCSSVPLWSPGTWPLR